MKAIAKKGITADFETIEDARRAAVLLHPLRLEILKRLGVPASAAEVADRMGLPRQRVNYHVRELARAGLLKRAGTRRKRNLIERLYVASASGYVLGPEVLGGAPVLPSAASASAATHLIATAQRSQAEVARAVREAVAEGQEVPTYTIDAELRFESASQRARFAEALASSIERVIRDHSSPAVAADGGAGSGRPHRLVVFCHASPSVRDP